MSSWFNLNAIKELKNKVQAAIPIDREMIAKLTLTTPEMNAERQQILEDERRKAGLKNSLAGMLPWETNDEERDILVEECKEAILALSGKVETFFGPYELPVLPVNVKDDEDDDDDEDGGGEDEEEQEKEIDIDKNQKPSAESLVKLEKLEPLPPLLNNFDLDAHVGLIERMLKVDPQLVEMQSMLSGGGEREKVFWRNYFFHCAFTRYEAGLSIDEIWSDQPSPKKSRAASTTPEKGIGEPTGAGAETETTIVFDSNESKTANTVETAFSAAPERTLEFSSGATAVENEADIGTNSNYKESLGNDFELIASNEDGAGDAELDELEAEIARELED